MPAFGDLIKVASKRCRANNRLKRSRAQSDFLAEQDSIRVVMRMRAYRAGSVSDGTQAHDTSHHTDRTHVGFPADHG